MIVLVRHGPSLRDAASPAREWSLTDDQACRDLGSVLPDLAVVSSDETKAVQTAIAIGREFEVDDRLREVERPYVDDADEFRAMVRRYLAGDPVPGWEPQADALDRFSAAASGIVVSHGTVMSLFVGSRTGMDPVSFWEGLRMPDAWQVVGKTVNRLVPGHGAGQGPLP